MSWKPWLSRWSQEWIRSREPGQEDPEILRDGWLGFAPATEDAVAAAEVRIGRTLPPSYREFLLTTDGWRHAGNFVGRMRDTSDIGWLRDIEPFWEADWKDLCYEDPAPENGNPLGRGLLISREADAGILFLDPGDVDAAGEWAAYKLFAWSEGPTRSPSFAALMEDLYASFHSLDHPEGETSDSWDVTVEQARRAALAGAVDAAAQALEQAEKFGRDRATVLRAQLQLFLARDSMYTRQSLRRWAGSAPESADFRDDPLFTAELLPVLFADHIANAHPNQSTVLQSAMYDERTHLVIGEYQARLRRYGPSLDFGNPEFDALIRQALREHANDSDALWEAVRAALVRWRPRTPDHIAPIVLLADPILAETLNPERGRALLSQPRG
ncbi:SMI1/KNR4 family protein [Nocardia sp. NPDC049526]|uniref:SMI1/KNR4 family protein n=1 Tax=Nocardia sp. NPDC049526 TaxID=3364316 RepID=UPI00379C9639